MTDKPHERWRLFDDHSGYVDRFGLLLFVTALAVITLSLVDLRSSQDNLKAEIGEIVVSVFVGATLLLALRASGVGKRFRIIADVIIGVGVLATIAFTVVSELSDSDVAAAGNPSVMWVLLSLLAPILVVRRLFHHDRATMQTLAGALSAYLLIALAFNFAFLATDVVGDSQFFGEPQPTTSFMYFSLVTITTLGYGDLTAVEPFGRLLTTTEAVVGQVYLVTFVAMIVGLLVGQREAEHRADD